jgi:hypothetical protein
LTEPDFLPAGSALFQKNFFGFFHPDGRKPEKVPKLRCFSLQKIFLKKLKKGVDKSNKMVYNNTCRHGNAGKQIRFRKAMGMMGA